MQGGRVNDVSATLNYYINKYMLFRFRYAYTHRWDCDFAPKVDLSAFRHASGSFLSRHTYGIKVRIAPAVRTFHPLQ